MVKDQDQVAGIMKAYIVGCLIASLDVYNVFLHGARVGEELVNRYSAAGVNANDLGLTLSLSIPMIWYIIVTQKKRIWSLFYFLCVPFLVVAIFLTASRGALISSIAAALIIPITFFKQSTRFKIMALLFIGITVFWVVNFIPSAIFERFAGIPQELQEGTGSKRIFIWHAGWQVFQDNAIFGVGIGAFPYAINKYYGGITVSHNAFLSILVEAGLIGFILFIAMLISLLNRIIRLPALERDIWIILILSWGLGAMSLTWDYYIQTWFLFGLAAAQVSVIKRSIE